MSRRRLRKLTFAVVRHVDPHDGGQLGPGVHLGEHEVTQRFENRVAVSPLDRLQHVRVMRQHDIRARVHQPPQKRQVIGGRRRDVFLPAVHAHHDEIDAAAGLERADCRVEPRRIAPRDEVRARVRVEGVGRRIPGARHTEKRHPPATAAHDHRLLRHGTPESGADELHPHRRQPPHRLLHRGFAAVPGVVVSCADDREPDAPQGLRRERGRREHHARRFDRVRFGRDRALEIPEQEIRRAQRVGHVPERIERVPPLQVLLGEPAPEVDVADGDQVQRIARPGSGRRDRRRRRRLLQADHEHQVAQHHVNRPSTARGARPRPRGAGPAVRCRRCRRDRRRARSAGHARPDR